MVAFLFSYVSIGFSEVSFIFQVVEQILSYPPIVFYLTPGDNTLFERSCWSYTWEMRDNSSVPGSLAKSYFAIKYHITS